MSNFYCEICGAAIIDSPSGYVTECKHYPLDARKRNLLVDLTLELTNDSFSQVAHIRSGEVESKDEHDGG